MKPGSLKTPRALYIAFTVVAFLLALRWTFPSEAVKERLIYEAGAAGWQIDVADVRPGGLLGIRMKGLTLTDAAGLKLPVEELAASLRPLPLLVGKRTLDFRALLYGGKIEGRADLSGGTRRLDVTVANLDLAPILPLRKASNVDLLGMVNGSVELTYPGPAIDKANGSIELSVDKAGIAGGQVPVSGFQEGFNLFPVALGNLKVSARAKDGMLDVPRLQAVGGDLELEGEGVRVMLQPRLAFSPLGGRARIRILPGLWQKPAASQRKPIIEAMMANARTPSGVYQYQLFGSVSVPRFAPAPNGPQLMPPQMQQPGGPGMPAMPPPGGPPIQPGTRIE